MAYSRYATEMKDGDNNIYGLMDEEARAQLSDLNSAFNAISITKTKDTQTWVRGGISSSDGNNSDSSARLRTGMFSNSYIKLKALNSYTFGLFCYDSAEVYKGCWNGTSAITGTITWFDEVYLTKVPYEKLRVVLKNPSGSTMDVSEAVNIEFYISIIDTVENDIEFESIAIDTRLSFVHGGISSSDGSLSPSSANRICAVAPVWANSIKANTGYQYTLFAWAKSDASYLGCWNGSGFGTSMVWHSDSGNIKAIRETTYAGDIVVVVRKTDNSAFISIPTDAVMVNSAPQIAEVYEYGSDSVKRKTINTSSGSINDSTTRLMQNPKTVIPGDVVHVIPNGLFYYVAVRDLKKTVHPYTDSAIYDSEEKEYTIQHSGQLILVFSKSARASGADAIDVSDYVSKAWLIYNSDYIRMRDIYKDELTFIRPYGNLMNSERYTGALDLSGELDDDTDYITSGMIELPVWRFNSRYNPFKTVYALSNNGESFGENFTCVCFYDKDKTFISKLTETPLTIPSGGTYVRVTFPAANSRLYVGCGILTDPPTYQPYHPVLNKENMPCIANTIHNSDGAKTNLVRTALQYYKNTDFGYGNTHTAFSESAAKCESDGIVNPSGTITPTQTYEGEKFQIDCSGFTRLSTQCTYPKYSRHYLEKNIVPQWGYKYDESAEFDTPEGRLTAHKQALYAFQRGLMYPVKADYSNVEVGDLIFVSGGGGLFDGIGHSRLVVNVDELATGGNRVTIMEATSDFPPVHASTSTERANNQYYGARLPLPYGEIDRTPIGTAQAIQKTLTDGDKVISEITLSEALNEKEIYTIVFNAVFDSNENYCEVSGFGNSFDFSDLLVYDGLHCKSILIPVNGSAGSSSVTISGHANGTVEFGGAKIYKGFFTP